jgi:membrane protein YdbS with pleckstrin-like domain
MAVFPTKPDGGIIRVWRKRALLWILAVWGIAGGPFMFIPALIIGSQDGWREAFLLLAIDGGALALFYVVGVPIAFWYTRAAWREMSFEAQKDAIVVRRGVVFKQTIRIPLRRVQDIIVKEGPFLRKARLQSLKLDTAGGGAGRQGSGWSEGQMPGLRDGDTLAQDLLEKVKRLRGDV